LVPHWMSIMSTLVLAFVVSATPTRSIAARFPEAGEDSAIWHAIVRPVGALFSGF
jgi:hypothetical protein